MAARFGRVVIDVGAGDGGYAVHRARGEPNTFAIAIDASPDALSDGAWRAHRLRLSNVAFLVTAVEQLPGALDETADEITVHFPWGSLLRGMLAADSSIVGRLAGSLRTEGELRLLVSAVERDGYSKVTPARLLELAPRYEALGLDLVESGWATPADIARSRSSWAKRLGPRPGARDLSASPADPLTEPLDTGRTRHGRKSRLGGSPLRFRWRSNQDVPSGGPARNARARRPVRGDVDPARERVHARARRVSRAHARAGDSRHQRHLGSQPLLRPPRPADRTSRIRRDDTRVFLSPGPAGRADP